MQPLLPTPFILPLSRFSFTRFYSILLSAMTKSQLSLYISPSHVPWLCLCLCLCLSVCHSLFYACDPIACFVLCDSCMDPNGNGNGRGNGEEDGDADDDADDADSGMECEVEMA